jgi:carboxylesterase
MQETSLYKGESFLINRGKRAIILIHGFTASTQEMESLCIYLSDMGFTTITPLLKGHNRSYEEFSLTNSDNYFESVLEAYKKVENYESVDVIGLSFGAILALDLAHTKKIRKVCLLAPSIFFTNKLMPFVPFLSYYKKRISKSIKYNRKAKIKTLWDLNCKEGIMKRIAYPFYSLPQLNSVLKFIKKVKNEISLIKNPILIIHSENDKTVKYSSSEYIFRNVGSIEKYLVTLTESGHIITEDYEADIVKEKILYFLNN